MIDVTNKFPYKDFEIESIFGVGYFVKIPKIFVKSETDQQTGFITRRISNEKIKGYHCHPAFMYLGHEKNYLWIGCYLTKGTIQDPESISAGTPIADTISKAKTAASNMQKKAGMPCHVYNIYDDSILKLLALIEYETPALRNIEPFASNLQTGYHGIENFLYSPSFYTHLDGIKTTGNQLRIFDNLGNGQLQETGLTTDNELTNGSPNYH